VTVGRSVHYRLKCSQDRVFYRSGGGTTPLHSQPSQMTQMTVTVTNPEGKVYISLVQDPAFISAIEGLQSFVFDNTADIDMAYDWVCDQAECHSFVCDNQAWDMFYETWQSAAEDAGFDDATIAGDSRY